MSDTNTDNAAAKADEAKDEATGKTFTQEDVDRIVAERLERDRKARDLSPDEVKALKAQVAAAAAEAEASKTSEQKTSERLAAVEAEMARATAEARRARVQARYGISDADADLFLTADDEQTLVRQAERLAESIDTQTRGHVRREGHNPRATGGDVQTFLRDLTNRS